MDVAVVLWRRDSGVRSMVNTWGFVLWEKSLNSDRYGCRCCVVEEGFGGKEHGENVGFCIVEKYHSLEKKLKKLIN